MSIGVTPQNFTVCSVRLENFRIYTSKRISVNGDIVLFIGKNGIGKTSILEAISLLGNLKSFRGAADKDLIHFGANQYYIEMEYRSRTGSHKIGVGYGKNTSSDTRIQRKMQWDGRGIEKISDFIGKLQTVVFAPNDVDIIESGPNERRRFFDIVLAGLHTPYLVALQNYRRLLKHRSSLFQKSAGRIDERFLTSLDQEMIKNGSIIQSYREKFTKEFQGIFGKFVSEISSGADQWLIDYRPSIEGGEDPESYRKKIELSRNEDIRYRQTMRGVHRDRILISNNKVQNLDIIRVGSQGQKRTVVLALKMAQYMYTNVKTSEKPILLIDDVMNELDLNRRKKFIEFLNEAGQAFITATDILALNDIIEKKKESSAIQIHELD